MNKQNPFTNSLHKVLWLRFKTDGTILELFPYRFGHFITIHNALKKSKNVNRYFDLPKSIMSENHMRLYNRKEALFFDEGYDDFYTSLPVIGMTCSRISDNELFGVIFISEVLPVMFDENDRSTLIYLDTDNKLVGFTEGLCTFFKESCIDSESLLDRPASDFLEILPDKSQKDKIASQIRKTETGWIENSEKKIVSSDWNGNNILELRESINAFKEDLKLTFEIKSDIDRLPGIILGDLKPIGEFYDRNGYSISIYPLTKRICIKKRGYIIQSGPTINKVTGKYVLIKSGGFFLLTKDGEEILSFYDIHPIERTDLWITLFKRTDDNCSIDRVLIEKRTSEQQETNEEIITYLRNSERTPCLLDRVLSFSLAGTHSILRAYRVRSITAFQSRITRLEKLLTRERNEGERLKELLSQGDIDQSIMIGKSKVMQVIREKADKFSRTNISILIQGATGTGKEILAHYIHNKSSRAKGPFIKIDCSILPPSLLESELFGHEKGAFTGAEQSKEGLFESADGGTLFIDEISNLPMQSQAKLLQFLQDRSLIRLGGKKKRKIDTRIIVAANESLPNLVKEGRFREDLYYRFAVATFELPSLKDRLEDLHLLSDYFLSVYSKSCGKEVSSLTNDAYEKMFSYAWPGNIRELRNVIEQAVLLCDADSISAQLIRFPGDSSALAATVPEKMRKTTRHINANRDELIGLLLKYKGSVIKCAAELEVTTRALYYCLKLDNLNPKDFKRFVNF